MKDINSLIIFFNFYILMNKLSYYNLYYYKSKIETSSKKLYIKYHVINFQFNNI